MDKITAPRGFFLEQGAQDHAETRTGTAPSGTAVARRCTGSQGMVLLPSSYRIQQDWSIFSVFLDQEKGLQRQIEFPVQYFM